MATITQTVNGPIPEFLEKVSNNWGLTFVYPKIWCVTFAPVSGANSTSNLGIAIQRVLTTYGDINNFKHVFNTSSNPYGKILNTPSEVNISVGNSKHFLLANKISIPGEHLQIGSGNLPSADSAGGILWGRASNSRISNPASANKFKISFFDTNKEIIDLLIKPWLIAVSYQGLIEDATCPQLKCNISASFFAKSSARATVSRNKELQISSNIPQYYNNKQNSTWATSNATTKVSQLSEDQPFLRKTVTFVNCVPINIPEKHYNFGGDVGIDEILTDIEFSYDYYKIEDVSAGQITANRKLVAVN